MNIKTKLPIIMQKAFRVLERPVFFFLLLGIIAFSPVSALDGLPPPPPPIQQGINAASDGDTVLVPPGTYFENIDFLGKAIVVKSLEGREKTVIDGGYNGSVVSFCGCEDTTSVLDGFTIIHGKGTYNIDYEEMQGGGIYAFDSPCKIIDCIIEDNMAGMTPQQGMGGGLYINGYYSGEIPHVMRNCIIRKNLASAGGGGVFAACLSGYITNCRIMNNETTGYFSEISYRGGKGGGVYISEGNDFLIQKCIFSRNSCTRPNDEYIYKPCAGALWCGRSNATIRENLFIGNSAVYGGAIYIASYSQGTAITRNLFLENCAGDYWTSGEGGAIEVIGNDAYAVINNNAFIRNGSYRGLEREPWAGAIGHWRYGGCVVNNIVAETLSGFACDVKYPINHHNCYWDNADGDTHWPGEGSIFLNPRFIEIGRFDYRVKPSSPCIDAGSVILDDTTFCGTLPDIGAWEECLDFLDMIEISE